jgi:hypothetical protein
MTRKNDTPPEALRTLLENTSRYCDEDNKENYPHCKVCGGLGGLGGDGGSVEHFPDCGAEDIVTWAKLVWPTIDLEWF